MAWNHKSRVVAMGVVIQPVAGTFLAPNRTTDLIPISPPTNGSDIVSADDPTATGTIWASPRIFLGETSTAGATAALRGPPGGVLPAANAWPIGRILQAAGFAELINAADIPGSLIAGSTTTGLMLGAGSSAVDDFYLGMPIQHANIGAAGTLKANTAIVDYNGTTKLASIAETIAAPAAASPYTIPACLCYQLGTLVAGSPLLSISVWRDKKRYDYRDCRITSLVIDTTVANEQNAGFPSLEFAIKGLPQATVDDTSPPLPAATLAVPIPPYRNGKFVLDRVPLGHQSGRFTIGLEVAGPSNAAAAQGQDAYETMSGTRTLSLDINQMAVADFDLATRVTNQTILPQMSLWGMGPFNRFMFATPELVLNPMNPGDRNGFVNLTGDAAFPGVDKSATLAVW